MKYAILYNPGHNRVYFETSLKLSISEFSIVSQNLTTACTNIERQNLFGVDYLTFETKEALSAEDEKKIFDLSFIYALFQLETIGEEIYFKPVRKNREDFVDEGIGAILKYTGKTNEIFTRMMINVAAASCTGGKENTPVRLLDPIAGKGTTLYEGLVKGYDVYGIEIGDKVVKESYHFLKKFLEMAKYKFDSSIIKVSGPNRSFSALRHTFVTAKTKEDFKNKNTRIIEMVAGNSMYASQYYKKNFFDIIVGDLPYGVQHGNVTTEKQSSLTRNPSELLKACLPSWKEVLRPGGCIVLAWNSNVLPKMKMEQFLEEQGFEVIREGAYSEFEHRVDQAILRDIVTARKK